MGDPLTLPLTEQTALSILRDIAGDTRRLILTHHAKERMVQRKATLTDVIRVIKRGRITEGPAQAANGSWELKMEGVSAGTHLQVVVAIDFKELIIESCVAIVVTVIN